MNATTHVVSLLAEHVKPLVRKIDQQAHYPLTYLQSLGESGLLRSTERSAELLRVEDVQLVEQTAQICMTTAFNLWCHLASATYLRLSGREHLQHRILPLLENGQWCGGTGLSNPMKFYAGLEKLCLKARRVAGGYVISGQLPAVSNLGPQHAFACIAARADGKRIMAYIPHDSEGLEQVAKVNFIGLNGSATYACKFNDVYIADDWIISEDADEYVLKVRATFILYQIPLGLGVTAAAVQSIVRASHVQGGCNSYLELQPEQLENDLVLLREQTYELANSPHIDERWHELLQLRLAVVKLTMAAVQANMIHCGGSAYLQASAPARRLREAYFFANLTPTMKHLEKLLKKINNK